MYFIKEYGEIGDGKVILCVLKKIELKLFKIDFY